MYRVCDQAAPLAYLRVNADEMADGCHPTMREWARAACVAHNRAIDLLMGEGEFSDDWQQPAVDDNGQPVAEPFDPGVFAPALESLCHELRTKQSPYALADAELVRHRVGMIVRGDKAHPVAKHWRVLRDRCYGPGAAQSWPEIAGPMSAAGVV